MTRFLFVPGLFLGLALGIVLSLYFKTGATILSRIGTPAPATTLVHCANEVKTDGWKTYRNMNYGFELRYPEGFDVRERTDSIILTEHATPVDAFSIVLYKIRGSLTDQIMPEMHQAGWKIADRQLYALTTSYYTNDDQSLSAIYLFVRDFPLHENTGEYSMMRATITTTKDEFLAAKNAKLVDPESILTTPEEILSTFRFLQYDELPGRDTGAGLSL